MQGGLPQQTGVIIQPQQLVLASGNKVQGNQQVLDTGLDIVLKEQWSSSVYVKIKVQ